ncbi:MAG: hypothetical protein FWH31_10775, partial [Streptococcaceae bacterium]|nr:hypothetical protein [Streptococcaceae bacterium]
NFVAPLSVCLAAKACIFAPLRYPFVLSQQSWQDEMVRAKGKAPSRSGNPLGETTSISVAALAQMDIL